MINLGVTFVKNLADVGIVVNLVDERLVLLLELNTLVDFISFVAVGYMVNDHFLVLTLNLLRKLLILIKHCFFPCSTTNQDYIFLVKLLFGAPLDILLALLPGFEW